MLAAGSFPKHRTLCDFRVLHLNELVALFMQVVKLTDECGLIKLGTIPVEGTKPLLKARHLAADRARTALLLPTLSLERTTTQRCGQRLPFHSHRSRSADAPSSAALASPPRARRRTSPILTAES